MWVLKYRIGYGLLVAALTLLLFRFSASGMLWLLVLLACLAIVLVCLLWIDAKRFVLKFQMAAGGRIGSSVRMQLEPIAQKWFLAAGMAAVDLEIIHVMTGETETERILLPLRERQKCYETELTAVVCGEMIFRCKGIEIRDVLGLFRMKCAAFPEKRIMIYPEKVTMSLTLSHDIAGSGSLEGKMQNRSGNDQSEMFDIRDYVPGDDIRSIHWKLSSKTDNLILRQPSKPFRYDFALMPDFGLEQAGGTVSKEELNRAAALVIALGDELLAQAVNFCMIIPGKRGIQICEVHSGQEWYQLLPQWFGVQMPQQSGSGMKFFLAEHLEQYFSRLVIFSAGKYASDIRTLGSHIGVTLIGVEKEVESALYTTLGIDCETVVFPAESAEQAEYKIIC